MNCLDESNPDTKPDNLERLMPEPPREGLTLCYLTFEDALAMRTTGDVEGEDIGTCDWCDACAPGRCCRDGHDCLSRARPALDGPCPGKGAR